MLDVSLMMCFQQNSPTRNPSTKKDSYPKHVCQVSNSINMHAFLSMCYHTCLMSVTVIYLHKSTSMTANISNEANS